MVYLVALFEAAVFTLTGAVVTLASAIFFRYFLAIAWRMWLWGSIGMVVGGVLFLAVVMVFFSGGVGIAGAELTSTGDVAITDLFIFGPVVITTFGMLLGCWYGWRRARQRFV